MFIVTKLRGRTQKVVTVGDVTTFNRAEIADFAMSEAGEDRSSLFGYTVDFVDDDTLGLIATVTLWTD